MQSNKRNLRNGVIYDILFLIVCKEKKSVKEAINFYKNEYENRIGASMVRLKSCACPFADRTMEMRNSGSPTFSEEVSGQKNKK